MNRKVIADDAMGRAVRRSKRRMGAPVVGRKERNLDLKCDVAGSIRPRLTGECLQLHGGYGFMLEYPIGV